MPTMPDNQFATDDASKRQKEVLDGGGGGGFSVFGHYETQPDGTQVFVPSSSFDSGGGGGAIPFSLFGSGGSQAATTASTLGGGAVAASGSWYTNPQLWGAVLGGLGGYFSKDAGKTTSGGPWYTDSTTSPYPSAGGDLDAILEAARKLYGSQGGGGGRGVPGASSAATSIADEARRRAFDSSLTDMAGGVAGQVGAGSGYNQFMDALAAGGTTAYYPGFDQFVARGATGEFGQDPFLEAFLGSEMGNLLGGGGGGGVGGGGGSYRSGPVGGGDVGSYQFNDSIMSPWLKDVLNGKWLDQNNPYMDEVIQGIGSDYQTQQEDALRRLDAEAMGGNRYGGSTLALERSTSRRDMGEQLAQQIAQTRMAEYEAERSRMEDALGQLTSLEGSDMQRQAALGSARASAGASRYATDSAADTARRQMLVQALLGHSGDRLAGFGLAGDLYGTALTNEQKGLDLMGNMAALRSNDVLGLLGSIPGLEASRFTGLTAAGGLQDSIDAQNRAKAQWAAGANNRQWQNLQNWLQTVMPIAGTFGGTHSEGVTAPGMTNGGGNAAGNTLAGILSGWAIGKGVQGG